MAHSERHLIHRFLRHAAPGLLALACFGVALVSTVRAQGQDAPAVTFRILALDEGVDGVCYDQRGGRVELTTVTAGFSTPYEVPAGGKVVFYRLRPAENPDEAPIRVTVADVNMAAPGPHLVFMASKPDSPSGVGLQVVDDSWSSHPPETVRLFNFSRRPVAVKIKDETAELKPAENRVMPYVATGQFWMQAATREKTGEWVMRVSAPQVGPPAARVTAIMFDQLPSVDRPDTHELQLVKFIDAAPATP